MSQKLERKLSGVHNLRFSRSMPRNKSPTGGKISGGGGKEISSPDKNNSQ